MTLDHQGAPPLRSRRAFLKLATTTVTAVPFSAAIAACGASGSSGGPITLKLGVSAPVGDNLTRADDQWAHLVNRQSNGRMQIKVYPNSELGSDEDMVTQARSGSPVIGGSDPTVMGNYVPDFAAFEGPYAFANAAQMRKVMTSSLAKALYHKLERKTGLKVLSFDWYFGFRNVLCKTPVHTPQDLHGVKIRIQPDSPMFRDTLAAMGATPTPLDLAEAYTGIQQGVVSGLEAPLATLYTGKYYEVAHHLSLTHHFLAISGWMTAASVWHQLSHSDQALLLSTAEAAGKFMTQITLKGERDIAAKLQRAGVQVVTPDRSAFRQATAAVYTKFPAWTPGIHQRMESVANS